MEDTMGKINTISLLLVLMFFITMAYDVNAQGVAGEPYVFLETPVCYGEIQIRVNKHDPGIYTIHNCVLNRTVGKYDYWDCNCQDTLVMSIPENQINKFDILAQYYVGVITNNELQNTGFQRIVPINGLTFTENPGEIYRQEEQRKLTEMQVETIISFIVTFVFVIFLIIILVLIYFFILKNKLRRWLQLGEDDKMTIGMIFKKIFRRESISRKSLGKRFEEKEETFINKSVKKTSVDDKIESEVQALLDDIRK